MTLVKICGLTRDVDVINAVDAGADALGFNFFPASPRFLSRAEAMALVALVPQRVWKVGLFVDATVETILDTAKEASLDTIQLLFQDPARERTALPMIKAAGYRILLTRRLDEESDLRSLAPLPAAIDHLLLDVLSPGGLGGTGHQIAESVIRKLEQSSLLSTAFLAGGLTPDNIHEKVTRCAPFGVDVASGVEVAPGIKSDEKMRRFITEAKR